MYIDSLVSINIYRDDEEKIINKIPLLYYWNGEGDLLTSILSDKQFKEKYLDKISLDNAKHLQIGYFYFKYDEDDNEQYIENITNIYDYLDLSNFDSLNMIYELIKKHMFELYKLSMKEDYDDVKVFNEEIIIDIYNKIKNKYKERLNKTTFVNWIRNELITKDNLNNKNTNYIIGILNNIFEVIN